MDDVIKTLQVLREWLKTYKSFLRRNYGLLIDEVQDEILEKEINCRSESWQIQIQDSLYVSNLDGTVTLVDDMGEIR